MARDLINHPLPSAEARGFIMRAVTRVARPLAALLALAAVLALLAGCDFHSGGDQIAWLTGDQLWVANPDGSSPRQLAPRTVAGFAWSPDHRELVFRYNGFTNPPPAGAVWASVENPSQLAVVSISGGSATDITPPANGQSRSDGWWDPQGNRLLYREYGSAGGASAAVYYDSQDDQPIGIARKVVLGSISIPTLAPDGMRVAVIDPDGNVLLGPPAQTGAIKARGALAALPATGRPGRLLWRPGHDQLVYPAPADAPDATTLRLLDIASGLSTDITSITNLLDASFSPNGALLLLRGPQTTLIWPVNGQAPVGVIHESDPLAQAYWSPDSRWLLMEDSTGLTLYSATAEFHGVATVTYAAPLAEPQTTGGTAWRPATANPWKPDSSAFVFATAGASWFGPNGQRASLRPNGPAGIWVEQLGASGPSGAPTLIASGNVTSPSWAYSDPSTVLLTPAVGT